jgi:hypothetical protein
MRLREGEIKENIEGQLNKSVGTDRNSDRKLSMCERERQCMNWRRTEK